MISSKHSSAAERRRGGALLMATVLMTALVGISVAILRVSSSVSSRQRASVDDLRAFYLAEAGLAEAYLGLARGYTGQIGSLDEPARVGSGWCWVDAVRTGELVSLRSIAVAGRGRASLEITVEPFDQPLGIFVDEGINLTTSFMLDGYDSEASPYVVQAGMQLLEVTGRPVRDPEDRGVIQAGQVYYQGDYERLRGNNYLITYSASHARVKRKDTAPAPPLTDVELTLMDTFDAAAAYFESLQTSASQGGGPALSALGPTTGGGAVMTTNGVVTITASEESPVEIFGDLYYGADDSTEFTGDVTVTGSVTPSREEVALAPVTAPEVEFLPGFTHSSSIPRVLPPGATGYDYIDVDSGSELVFMGGSQLVVGELLVRDGAHLTIANSDAPVDIFVEDSALLRAGATFDIESQRPADLSLQIGTAGVAELEATGEFRGVVYAPDADVSIGSEFEVFGSLISNTLDLAAGTRLHYDSGVEGRLGRLPLPRLLGWAVTEIPEQVKSRSVNPFTLALASAGTPISLGDSMVTESWVGEFKVWAVPDAKGGKAALVEKYTGPLDKFVPPASWVRINFDRDDLEPPTMPGADWHVSYDLLGMDGEPLVYSGLVRDMPEWMATKINSLKFWRQ